MAVNELNSKRGLKIASGVESISQYGTVSLNSLGINRNHYVTNVIAASSNYSFGLFALLTFTADNYWVKIYDIDFSIIKSQSVYLTIYYT